jgi:hypothetical protein
MINHFESIGVTYGDVGVRLPNGVFRSLSDSIKSRGGNTNIQQVAFAYTYLVTISFLYKYTCFVDTDSGVYVQSGDIKELLGYSRITKSIDKVIKKGGILDSVGLTSTTKDYPVRFITNPHETLNGIPIREFITIGELDDNDILYSAIKSVVKNRNYEIKEPLFLTSEYSENIYGTLYGTERTHEIKLKEFLAFLADDELSNIDFLIYGYIKSRCKGYVGNKKSIAVYKIISEIGIDRSTFYNHIELLKKKKYISVNHKDWKMKGKGYMEMLANEYIWLGL